MNVRDVHVGQRVAARHQTGTVTHVGTCYWPGCRYGADCVEIEVDGGSRMNHRASALEPEGDERPVAMCPFDHASCRGCDCSCHAERA